MRELEEREFQKIYVNIATGIALTNLDGFFEECNAAYSALTGYSQDELRKMQFFALTHPEDLDEIKRRIKALLEGREPQFEIERRYIAKSGATVWVRNFVSTIPDAEGRPAPANEPDFDGTFAALIQRANKRTQSSQFGSIQPPRRLRSLRCEALRSSILTQGERDWARHVLGADLEEAIG